MGLTVKEGTLQMPYYLSSLQGDVLAAPSSRLNNEDIPETNDRAHCGEDLLYCVGNSLRVYSNRLNTDGLPSSILMTGAYPPAF